MFHTNVYYVASLRRMLMLTPFNELVNIEASDDSANSVSISCQNCLHYDQGISKCQLKSSFQCFQNCQVAKSQKLLILDLCKPSNTTFVGLNFFRVLLHGQNKMNAKKITLALTVAILPYGVWF